MDFAFDPPTREAAAWRPDLVGGLFADRGLCGCSLNRGLLRFHDAISAPPAQATVDAMFGARGLHAQVFAFDWLARQFAVTTLLAADGSPDSSGTLRTVAVLDPFDGSVTPWCEAASFETALNVPFAQDFLQPTLFSEWLTSAGIGQLHFDSCAGSAVPGFYGGKRELANLSIDSTEVYLSFAQQLWEHGQLHGHGSPAPRLSTPPGSKSSSPEST